MVATVVARPVLDAVATRGAEGVLLASSGAAAHVAVGEFVLAVLPPGATLLPNGIAVAGRGPDWPPPGSRVALRARQLRAGCATVDLRSAIVWEPAVPRYDGPLDRVRLRGREILAALGLPSDAAPRTLAHGLAGGDPAIADAVLSLLDAVTSRDGDLASAAAHAMIGRGPGLTPRADDLVAGIAGAVAAFAGAAGWSQAECRGWAAGLAPADVRSRTTALSATMLELATAGRLLEPVHGILRVGGAPESWRRALQRLCGTGHSTGPAYAAAIGATALALQG